MTSVINTAMFGHKAKPRVAASKNFLTKKFYAEPRPNPSTSLRQLKDKLLVNQNTMDKSKDIYSGRMTSSWTDEEFTEKELLLSISEDVGRLSNIETTLQEEGEHATVYNRIMGIELRTYETVNVLFSIKRLLYIIAILLVFILIVMLLK